MRQGNRLIEDGKVPEPRKVAEETFTNITRSYYLDGIEAGYEVGYEDGRQSYAIALDSKYQQGYAEGLNDANGQKTYEQGLEDAWSAAKTIVFAEAEERKKITGYAYIGQAYSIRNAFEQLSTPVKAIQKIHEYEEKQKKSCATCFYGDKHDRTTNMYCIYNCTDDTKQAWQPKEECIVEMLHQNRASLFD